MKKDIKIISISNKDSLGEVIPNNWEIKNLNDVCDFLDTQRIPIKDTDRTKMPGIYPYYGASGIIDYVNKYIFDEDLILLAEDGANIINRSTPIAFLVNGKIWVNNHAHVLKARPLIDRYYLCAYLESLKYDKYNTGTAQPKLNRETCEKLPVLIPPLPEQRKIANILSTWDKAIEKQRRLIEKLELRKKGLMQQLLTEKKRLPGFSGEWKKIAIKDFAIEVSLKNNRNENWEVLSCTKYDGLVPSLQYFGRQVFSKDITQYKIVPQYCFAYATNHIEEGSIGYQSIYKNSLISPMYTVFKTDSNMIDDIFLYKLLKSHRAIYLYNVMMEGSIDRRGGLRWDNFSTIKIFLPDIKEQSAIADILVSCDNEILLAKQKLNKIRQQKKGLMQVLLTGKKRVNI